MTAAQVRLWCPQCDTYAKYVARAEWGGRYVVTRVERERHVNYEHRKRRTHG